MGSIINLFQHSFCKTVSSDGKLDYYIYITILSLKKIKSAELNYKKNF